MWKSLAWTWLVNQGKPDDAKALHKTQPQLCSVCTMTAVLSRMWKTHDDDDGNDHGQRATAMAMA